jgi:NitT/TauT family transport system substrate-binding protein
LLAETLAAGRLDAVLTYWQFAAKAEAAGMRRLLSVQDALHGLGFERDVPMIGYVFSEGWAERNRPAMESFLDASRRARDLLATADDEWQHLAALTGAGTPGELAMLRDRYREGIPHHWTHADQDDARRLYELLARIGGPALVGSEATLVPGTFWQSAAL